MIKIKFKKFIILFYPVIILIFSLFLLVSVSLTYYKVQNKYSKIRENLYLDICKNSSTLRIEMEDFSYFYKNFYGIYRKPYNKNISIFNIKSRFFNIRVRPVVRRWMDEKLMEQRKSNDNTKSTSTSTKPKIWLYIDEGIFFPLYLNKSKILLKDKEILTKDFVCSSNFYKTYIKDNIIDEKDMLYFLENRNKYVLRLYNDYGSFSEETENEKKRFKYLDKYRNDINSIIFYEREIK